MEKLFANIWKPIFYGFGFAIFILIYYLFQFNLIDAGLQTINKNDIARIADLIKDEADKSGELSEDKAEELIEYHLQRHNGRTKATDKKNGDYKYQFEIIKPLDKYTYGSTGSFRLTVIQPRFSKIISSKNIKFVEERSVVNRGYFGEGYRGD